MIGNHKTFKIASGRVPAYEYELSATFQTDKMFTTAFTSGLMTVQSSDSQDRFVEGDGFESHRI